MADEFKREFAMTYADLIGVCDNVHSSMVRDAAEMLTYGITNLITAAFKTKIDEFLEFPTDSNLASDVMTATQNKNNLASELMIVLRTYATRAKLVFTNNKGAYDKFVMKDLSHASDNNLLVFAEMVGMDAEKYKTELAVAGLTQDMIDDLVDMTDAFRLAIKAQADAIKDRDSASNNRIKLANELYDLLTRYCEVGKTIWYETNEAKYNDYIIYTNISPGSLTAPQNFMFDPVNYDFSWSAVANATSYELQQSTDGINWEEYWTGTETSCAYEESPEIVMYYRVRGRNSSGFGPVSDTIAYDFAPPLVAPSNFDYDSVTYYFTWNAVPNAEFYEFQYRAETNPTWNSLNAGNTTSFYHVDPIGNYLARVRAGSGPNLGTWSNELEYTVSGGPS